MKTKVAFVFVSLWISGVVSHIQIPDIPAGHRAQYYLLGKDGGYKYGYDTGDGQTAKQSSSSSNQVVGSYSYTNPSGQKLDVKYTAGVQGFVPEEYVTENEVKHTTEPREETTTTIPELNKETNAAGSSQTPPPWSNYGSQSVINFLEQSNSSEAKLRLIQLLCNEIIQSRLAQESSSAVEVNQLKSSSDGSYSYGFTVGGQERHESADAQGNVRGRYSYQNEAGTHDLSYVAGSSTGFLPIGGSLSVPPGLSPAQLEIGARQQKNHQRLLYTAPLQVPGTNIWTYLTPQYPQQYGYVYETTY